MRIEAACTLIYNGRYRRRFKRCVDIFRYVGIWLVRHVRKNETALERNIYYRIDQFSETFFFACNALNSQNQRGHVINNILNPTFQLENWTSAFKPTMYNYRLCHIPGQTELLIHNWMSSAIFQRSVLAYDIISTTVRTQKKIPRDKMKITYWNQLQNIFCYCFVIVYNIAVIGNMLICSWLRTTYCNIKLFNCSSFLFPL